MTGMSVKQVLQCNAGNPHSLWYLWVNRTPRGVPRKNNGGKALPDKNRDITRNIGCKPLTWATACALTLGASGAVAGIGGQPVAGAGVTLGDGHHIGSVMTMGSNPAGPAAAPRVGIQLGVGGGFGFELGPVDNLIDDVDEISSDLEEDGLALDEAEETIDKIEDILETMGDDGWGKFNARGDSALITGRAGDGWAVELGYGAKVHGGFSVLDDEVRYIASQEELQTRTSLYLKGGSVQTLSFAPSMMLGNWGNQSLYAGLRVNRHDVDLSKAVVALKDDSERDFGDIVGDELERKQRSSSALGYDLGLYYKTSFLGLGATLLNVNEPSFDFPSVGRDCGTQTDADLQANCYTAQSFASRIDLDETWTMNQQMRLDAAVSDPAERIILAMSYDANSVNDISGDEYQWMSYSAAFRMPWYLKWIPDLRAGYRQNLAGSELSYTSVGMTFLGALTLDAAMSNETIENEGDEIPRSVMFNLGLQLRF